MFLPQIGWGPGTWACKSLASAGFNVIAGEDEDRVPNRTRYASELVRYPAPGRDPDGFLTSVEEICTRRRVAAVLPSDDRILGRLITDQPCPEGVCVIGPTADQYRKLCDKLALDRLAETCGFSTPTRVVAGRDGRPSGPWPPLPSMVKPRGLRTCEGFVLSKPTLVRSAVERDTAVRRLVEKAGEAIVEEHICGTAWRVHFVRDRKTMLAMTIRSVRSYPPYTGQSSVQRVTAATPDLIELARRLLEAVDYRGPGSIQAIERDGRFFVHDVNLRLPVTVGLTIRAGLDMPRLAVEAALGAELPSGAGPFPHLTYVRLAAETMHLLDGLRGRETSASVSQIARDVVGAAVLPKRILHPFDLIDPAALLLFAGETLWTRGRRERRRSTVAAH